MIVGTVKEIKNNENRVGLTPQGVQQLVRDKHTVLVEKNAGKGSGFSDSDYAKAGAQILSAKEVWKKSGLIVKVKEPLEKEWPFIPSNQIIFTYFHFGSNEKLLDAMLKTKAATIAYETVGNEHDHPLLKPMSEVAGKMAPLMGAFHLAKFNHGKGLLVSGTTNVAAAHVVVLGSGVVGKSAATIAAGLQAKLTILVHSREKIPSIEQQFPKATVLELNSANISRIVPTADLLVGAVYATGEKSPVLVSAELVQKMQPGSVIVDVAIDQGGCIATSKPTTHEKPVYEKFGVIHYCVANMPGAFPRTSTFALTHETFPFVQALANNGLQALKKDSAFLNGLTTFNGKLVHADVAKTFGRKSENPLKLF